MEIKASSKYDWETIKKLNRFHYFTRLRVLTITLVIVLIVGIVGIIGQIPSALGYMQLFGKIPGNLISNVASYTVLTIFWLYLIFVLPKIRYKRDYFGKDTKNDFVFTDENIKLTQTQELHSGESVLSYNAIRRVYEAKEFFYMYIGKRGTYIVDKSTVTGGTSMDLRMLLISKIGADKYKIKCKA